MRNVKIGITSLATFEDILPPYNLRQPSVDENIALALSLLDTAGKNQVDIVVLPESFAYAGITGSEVADLAEVFPGRCVEAVAEKARQHSMNVIAGFYSYIDGSLRNIAVLFDRNGTITGTYMKRYTTQGEIDNGVIPGESQNVFETDIGKIGIAICFDINWSDIWTSLEGNADIVFWISAYEGGFPLQARAWLHRLPVVTSVMSYHGKLIDITGKVLTSTSRWNRVVIAEYNLDREIFHVDNQYAKIQEIQNQYGNKVSIESFTEEHTFILQSNSNDISVASIIQEHNLINYRDYIQESAKAVKRVAG